MLLIYYFFFTFIDPWLNKIPNFFIVIDQLTLTQLMKVQKVESYVQARCKTLFSLMPLLQTSSCIVKPAEKIKNNLIWQFLPFI